ncbi:MAG: hypothetical protein C0597_06490, partial [Marinilabiliales bacterium]
SKSSFVLPDSLVFSSTLPGFKSEENIKVYSEFNGQGTLIANQYVSDQYFDFFNYTIITEKPGLFMNHDDGRLVYINESALKSLGIGSVDDCPGTILIDERDNKLIICGVVKDYDNLCLVSKPKAKIFQLTSDHLAYAFFSDFNEQPWLTKNNEIETKSDLMSFQDRMKQEQMIWEDVVYSAFLFINIFILIICLGYIGIKYAYKNELDLVKILGIGIHVLTIVISKTYIYLLAIMGFVVGPIAYLLQKVWLEIYVNRVNFGLIDLFIILSMALLTVYLVCCPKRKLDDQLKGKTIQHNSI